MRCVSAYLTCSWLDYKQGIFWNSFALDNATVEELLVVLLERWSPIVQFYHSVAINCICLCNWPSVKSEENNFQVKKEDLSVKGLALNRRKSLQGEIGGIFYYPRSRCKGCRFGADPCRLVPHYQRLFFLPCQHGFSFKGSQDVHYFAGSSKLLVGVSMWASLSEKQPRYCQAGGSKEAILRSCVLRKCDIFS